MHLRAAPGERFLASEREPREYLEEVAARARDYNGFNLLAGDIEGVFYFSSRDGPGTGRLSPGIHGLSNHLLDTPWPKVTRGKLRLQAALAEEPGAEALAGPAA